MAIVKPVGSQVRPSYTFEDVESLTQSTATAVQNLSAINRASTLGMGTATGFARNRYFLPAGSEGQEKWIYTTGTGEAWLDVAGTTSTGSYTFAGTGATLFHLFRYLNAGWRAVAGNATIATATNS